ncbi:hypothetical protein [Levilactobacillus enshiensis]|uniref:hypothetical protein n=1 Tax=Levilactobacillus enshiensis TaxID=2590213 RepID=UPI00117AFC14|nr:hypothetical protein [Levilactobacillus enshiensis]
MNSNLESAVMSDAEYDAIFNPKNEKNIAAVAKARATFANVEKYKDLVIEATPNGRKQLRNKTMLTDGQ